MREEKNATGSSTAAKKSAAGANRALSMEIGAICYKIQKYGRIFSVGIFLAGAAGIGPEGTVRPADGPRAGPGAGAGRLAFVDGGRHRLGLGQQAAERSPAGAGRAGGGLRPAGAGRGA